MGSVIGWCYLLFFRFRSADVMLAQLCRGRFVSWEKMRMRIKEEGKRVAESVINVNLAKRWRGAT